MRRHIRRVESEYSVRGLSGEHLGSSMTAIATELGNAGLTTAMELLVRVDATGHTLENTTPLDVLKANLPAITILRCMDVHWHLVPTEKMSQAANCRALIDGGFCGSVILEIGGLPKSGGYGRDTDQALIDSHQRLKDVFAKAP